MLTLNFWHRLRPFLKVAAQILHPGAKMVRMRTNASFYVFWLFTGLFSRKSIPFLILLLFLSLSIFLLQSLEILVINFIFVWIFFNNLMVTIRGVYSPVCYTWKRREFIVFFISIIGRMYFACIAILFCHLNTSRW